MLTITIDLVSITVGVSAVDYLMYSMLCVTDCVKVRFNHK